MFNCGEGCSHKLLLPYQPLPLPLIRWLHHCRANRKLECPGIGAIRLALSSHEGLEAGTGVCEEWHLKDVVGFRNLGKIHPSEIKFPLEQLPFFSVNAVLCSVAKSRMWLVFVT